MKLKIKKLAFGAGRPVAFINQDCARNLNVHVGDRIEISTKKNKIISVVDVVKGFLRKNQIAISDEISKYLKLKAGDEIEVRLALEPHSTRYIAKKLNDKELSRKEIFEIIEDVVNNALTEAEVAYFVSGVYENGMSMNETLYLTEAIYKTGQSLKWKIRPIVDKHSIGGIAGNRTTPIVVSICAAAGIILPKTSSRAITSAAGTSDVIETIAKVDLSSSELQRVVRKVGACLVWGGALGLAPADDKLIRVERLLSLDPESQLIASIMAKKLAVGSKYVLIDIPYGPKAKVSKKEAKRLKKKFLRAADYFKIKMRVVLTDGSQPIGNGIGPIMEMKDVLRVLQRNNPPEDLEKKCIMLAGELLEMVRKARKGQGKKLAKSLLESGKAYKKFEEIISAQGKVFNGLKEAKFKHKIKAKKSGKIKDVNNKAINYLGRVLGCPIDKASGLFIHKHRSEKVEKSEAILTLYSESKRKLNEGIRFFNESRPIIIS